MAQDVRFLVFSSQEESAKSLRASIQGLEGTKIVAEVEEAALLPQAIERFPVDIVFIDLDPTPEIILPSIAELVSAMPSVSIFAASESTDGQLILKTMRVGAKEFLPKPLDLASLQEAIDKVASQRIDSIKFGKLITVMGSAGGVGATTLATNLAVELTALTEGQVSIVDLDYRFGQVATLLDVEPTYTLSDLCNSPEQLEQQVIERALIKHSSGLFVLSRPQSFGQADTVTAAACVGLLSNLLQFNDYVVVDGPTRFDLGAKALLDIADVNLLVTQLLVPTVRNASRILEEMRQEGHNLDRMKLVCNRIGRDSVALSVDDVAATLSMQPFATMPDEWSAVSAAINLGESLKDNNPKSRVRASIEDIALRLHDPSGADQAKHDKKGLIGRIFAGT